MRCQHLANRVRRQMPARYADSFVKQLGNLGLQTRTLLELIKEFLQEGERGS